MRSTARERGTPYSGNQAQELARDLLQVVASCIQGRSRAWTQQGHHCQDPGCKRLVPYGHGYEFGLTSTGAGDRREREKLLLGRRPKATMYIEDVADIARVLLSTTEMTFQCGWLRIQLLLFCQLAAITGSLF